MAVVIVATLFPVPEFRSEVIRSIEAAQRGVHSSEDGCELYALHEGTDGRLVFIEKYADQAAFDAHLKSEGLAALSGAIKGKLAQPMDVQVLTPHPGGSAEKGAL
jgi:quinol monooxygenase YgiN